MGDQGMHLREQGHHVMHTRVAYMQQSARHVGKRKKAKHSWTLPYARVRERPGPGDTFAKGYHRRTPVRRVGGGTSAEYEDDTYACLDGQCMRPLSGYRQLNQSRSIHAVKDEYSRTLCLRG